MHKRTSHIVAGAAAVAAIGLASNALAVVQTFSSASGTGSLTAMHPGGGFFQNDGQFDDGLEGDFGFGGAEDGFIQEIRADLGGGLTGAASDHGGFASMDFMDGPFADFWFGGLGNDAGPLPSTDFSKVVAWVDVLAPVGKPFQFRIESDFGPTGNGFVFAGVGAGTWQPVGGTLAQATPIGNFNPNDPNLAILVAFADEFNSWDSGPQPAAVLRIDNLSFSIDEGTWTNTGGGEWTDNANWSPIAPNGTGAIANFGSSITAPSTVNLNSEIFARRVRFDSPNSYTLSGPGSLTLRRIGFNTDLVVAQGNHTIDVPVRLMSNTDASIPVGNTLSVRRLTGEILNIQQGTIRIIPNGTADSTSNLKGLSIPGGATPAARFDLTNNALVIDYDAPDPSPLSTVREQIAAAFNGGSWNGNGITSSNATATTFGVGYGERSALANVPAIFGTVDSDAVLLRLTRYGDANLDGNVNLQDFNALASNFGSTNGVWTQGDFTYDGNVNLQDFNRLAANFGLSAGPDGVVGPEDWAALAAVVPEPASLASLAFLGVPALAGMRRRRTRRASRA
jgi:hypothetical protein